MKLRIPKPILMGSFLALLTLGVVISRPLPDSSLLQRTVIHERSILPRMTPAPEFKLTSIQGTTIDLEELKRTPFVLVFVSYSCPYCRKLKQNLIDLGLPDMRQRLVFITQTYDRELSAEIQALEDKISTLFPVLPDSTAKVFKEYKAFGVPTA